jgi:gamma-glutamyltranspeptidase/glutathione hydrolase
MQWRSTTRRAANGMVCSVDHLASSAGVAMLRAGGNAVDAAIAASAVLAVTTQQMCGLGGDLLALVSSVDRPGRPDAVIAAGRAGSGADADAMRAEGLLAIPERGDLRAVTVPGCVDGWVALHERGARLPLTELLTPAIEYARAGFPASPLLARRAVLVAHVEGAGDYAPPGGLREGDRVRRPLVAETLEAIASDGRDGFYRGRFGAGLVELGAGLFTEADLDRSHAEWVEPLVVRAWDHLLWTVPPPSQGYLTLASAWIADGLPLPDHPDDGGWAHTLVEAARWAGHDRPDVLFDGADGRRLVDPERLAPRRAAIAPDRRTAPAAPVRGGGTIHLVTADGQGGAVSLTQSNAAGWGCQIVVPSTGIFLHDRGIGFGLQPGHPAELAAGRRPPHTLAPALVTRTDGSCSHVLGTMGGDVQPQVILQLAARLLHHGQSPGDAIAAARWALGGISFSSWSGPALDHVAVEFGAPAGWASGLERRGQRVVQLDPDEIVGHAHVIALEQNGFLAGASDPRALTGGTAAY